MDVDGDQEMEKLKFAFLFMLGLVLRSEQRFNISQRIVPQILNAIKNSSTFATWVLQ